MIKGSAAAVITSALASELQATAPEAAVQVVDDYVDVPKYPDLYVEYAQAGEGKTTRLVTEATRWACETGGIAVIFSPEARTCDIREIQQRVINSPKNVGGLRYLNDWSLGGSLYVFTGMDNRKLIKEYAEAYDQAYVVGEISGEEPVRFFFDNWDLCEVPPLFYSDGYYTATLGHPTQVPDGLMIQGMARNHPEFRDKLAAHAEHVHIRKRVPQTLERIAINIS